LKRKFDILQQIKEDTGVERDPRKCIAWTTGNHGPKRRCDRWAIAGGTVCEKHGGKAPNVVKAAKQRLEALLLRKIERLDEISEQNCHMPSALGATQAIINRTMGKVGDAPKKVDTGTTIQIGIALTGDIKPDVKTLQIGPAISQRDEEDITEAEMIDDDEQDE
jgi:hypothetical protein